MSDDSLETNDMHNYIDRMRAGDANAANQLIRAAQKRLEKLAHRMVGKSLARRGDVDVDDILAGSMPRLIRSLGDVRPESTRSFYNLAAVQMRRELLDVIRAARRRPTLEAVGSDPDAGGFQAVAAPEDADLDRWAALHVAVEQLPVDEREVIGLTVYHGWSQMEIAVLLHVSDRHVRRIWSDAIRHLSAALGGQLPDL
ncbi:MAG TPA: sigma-70 family RNA polymerase sigma factor [Gemmataceae bacterium]|jgi:RNA polymerase sigma-70 factor (ECF subfamily)|nr:sigma-70 family RNA polymerase sigma factor [Gemmataceae bacterium]